MAAIIGAVIIPSALWQTIDAAAAHGAASDHVPADRTRRRRVASIIQCHRRARDRAATLTRWHRSTSASSLPPSSSPFSASEPSRFSTSATTSSTPAPPYWWRVLLGLGSRNGGPPHRVLHLDRDKAGHRDRRSTQTGPATTITLRVLLRAGEVGVSIVVAIAAASASASSSANGNLRVSLYLIAFSGLGLLPHRGHLGDGHVRPGHRQRQRASSRCRTSSRAGGRSRIMVSLDAVGNTTKASPRAPRSARRSSPPWPVRVVHRDRCGAVGIQKAVPR